MRAELFKNRIAHIGIQRDNVFPYSFWYSMYGEKCYAVKVDYFPIFFYRFLKFPITYLIAPVPRRRFIAE